MALKIDLGFKSYDIEDADGNHIGTIRFNPSDPGLAGRWESVEAAFSELGNLEELTPAKAIELDRNVKDRIDHALGSKWADVGDSTGLSLLCALLQMAPLCWKTS